MSFRYYAFISYSSKDKVWAQWLHKRLETYRIPRTLVGRPGRDGPIPKTLFPIFRDREELPLSSDLGSTIRDALESSACLIVICSRNAAKSRWVNKEIETFKLLGKEDRIFALILDGEPNATDIPGEEHLECFPPTLRYRLATDGAATDERSEPIGGDLRKGGDGQTKALQKTIAGILGIGFNAIAQREIVRQRIRYAYLLAITLLIILCGLAYWDYTRTKISYFRLPSPIFGIPSGKSEVDSEAARHLGIFYRFESSKNKIRRVLRINSSRTLVDDVELFNSCEEDIIYKEDGHIDYELFKDHMGKINAYEVFNQRNALNTSDVVDVKNASNQPLSVNERLELNNVQTTEATAFQLTYDASGHVIQKTYLNNYHSPTPDDLNAWSIRNVFKPNSNTVEKVMFQGADGQPSPNRNGVQSITLEPNDFGQTTDAKFYGANDKPVLSKQGFFEQKYKYDQWGNLIELSNFDVEGKPVLVDGYAKQVSHFDEHGNTIEIDYYGTDGNPILKDGLAKLEEAYDSRGFIIETRSYGIDGKPIIRNLRYWKSKIKYDDFGNVIQTCFFDLNDQPTFCNAGTACINDAYDDQGNTLREDYFGSDGTPVLVNGIASILFAYNDKGQIVTESYLGIDGKPALRNGAAKLLSLYDERGNKIQTDFYGIDGKLTLNSKGYARVKYKYDERGHKLETAYFNADGDAMNIKGISRLVSTYDDLGNETLVCTFDKDGQPALSDGYVRSRFKYDELGQRIGVQYQDERGKPTLCIEGWATIAWKLDEHSNITEELLLDVKGQPISISGVPARKVIQFDERGNTIESSFFGANGKPILNKDADNTAKIVTKYDQFNRAIESDYFGVDGKPILCGTGFAKALYRYDDHGHLIEDRYFGVNGEPILNKNGYYRTLATYDDRGHEIEGVYFGTDDKPIAVSVAGARKVWKYDARGNIREVDYFGIDGKPFEVNHAAKAILIYSPSDQLIEMDTYDKAGHLVQKLT